jgi:SAM-dependent methyltransferase
MSLTRAQFDVFLRDDERACCACERISEDEVSTRRLAPPATNLGTGRGRFWHLLRHLEPYLSPETSLADVGAYPGTALRLARRLPGGERMSLTALGFGFEDDFRDCLRRLDVALHEVEFDVRRPPAGAGHLLRLSLDAPFDVVICSEVIEHVVHPAALLVGLNRITRRGGTVLLTTNSVSFIGDVAKLLAGRHNVEALERSHVVTDYPWRPHVRLFTRDELARVFALAGFTVWAAYYFDNGNVYRGAKGAVMAALRGVTNLVPHLRSHVFIAAERTREPLPELVAHLATVLRATGLEELTGEPC